MQYRSGGLLIVWIEVYLTHRLPFTTISSRFLPRLWAIVMEWEFSGLLTPPARISRSVCTCFCAATPAEKGPGPARPQILELAPADPPAKTTLSR